MNSISDEKMIRFADHMNRELFTMPDGDKIVLIEFNDKRSVLSCKYIDDYHVEIDGHEYLHSEFTRIQERKGAIFAPVDMRPEDACGIYEIYQIKDTRNVDYAFRSFEEAAQKFNPLDYRRVYASMLPQRMTLDKVYELHNSDNRPFGDKIHSMSMSDIVIVSHAGRSTAHYVDRFGFTEAPQFFEPETAPKTNREVIHNYTVTVRIPVESKVFALAENPNAVLPFVTWQRYGNRKGYDLGHYFERRADAVKDLYMRVCKERDNAEFSPRNPPNRPKNRDDAR